MSPQEFKIKVIPLKNKLYRLSLRMLGATEEAEDAVQDAFVKLWTKRNELSGYSSVEAFAMTVTKNLCLDRIKSKSFQTERISDKLNSSLGNDPGNVVENTDFNGFIHRIIARLPDHQKAIMHMRDVEDYEYEQIAEVMGLNVNAVRVNLSRARKKVRDTILKMHDYELARN